MRWVFFAGESLTESLVDRWQSSFPNAEIVNLYGPAETTLAKCFYQLSSGVHHGVQPLGRPLPQTQALVLSRDNQLCSIGEPGEIVLRTPFRSLGYINNHEENRKRFVKNPFRDDEKDQLYYTGDSGRYRPDGMLEFLGRLDDQVKIRGVRVEPNEVTVTLARHPEVVSCFVTNKRDEQSQPRLVAYVVIKGQSTTTVSELRAYLSKELPVYMIPSAFVFLDALPLTTRGKVDRRALPAPDLNRSQPAEALVAPRDELELQLTKIWEKVLGVKNIGMKDNFFDLGGHSLLAVNLFARIQKIFGKDLPVTTLFQAPTIGQLARIIRQEGFTTPWTSLVPVQHGGSKQPFFCVHGCTGRVLHFHNLARHLDPEQPLYGLTALDLEKGQVFHNQIKDTAAHYIKEIQTIQFNGPYFIGGSGAGCTIVLEMAHQLKSQGQNVALIVLMTPTFLRLNKSSTKLKLYSYERSLKIFLRRFNNLIKTRPFIPNIKNTFFNRVLWHFRIFHRFIPVEIYHHRRFIDNFIEALLNYKPEPYHGRINCILRDEFTSNPQKGLGDWQSLSVGGLDVRFVPGTIYTMWEEPHVQILAEKLTACLNEAQKRMPKN
jgi:thioesterase domain-containing protein/acyl carrier protein